jgi:glycosyltransferase involved in cell wall biosynthesis
MRRTRPDIVHLISLRMVVIGGLAAVLARVPVRILALTGLGLLGADRSRRSRASLSIVRLVLTKVLSGPQTVYVFENREDPVRLGLDERRSHVAILGGAGVDPVEESAQPLPEAASLRLALVARMIFSKGVSVAVEAVARARRMGADIELTLVGVPDPGNPRSLTESDLHRMASQPGIRWLGRSNDVRAIWRDHHVACVPSLGGEGLPRSLLEAAAAGRAIVTTQTPGCATFVREEIEGLLVPPGDAAALAAAFTRLAADRARVTAMGQAARDRIFQGFTVDDVARDVMRAYDMALEGGAQAAGNAPGFHNRQSEMR